MKQCTVESCEEQSKCRGYCSYHYGQVKRYGYIKFEYRVKQRHGQSNSLTYISWARMIQRCRDPKVIEYKNYGGRGIKVCERWKGTDGFTNFVADMGERPSKDYSIDRVDNNGNYELLNCRWATRHQQTNNQRRKGIRPGVHKHKSAWIAKLRVNNEVVLQEYFTDFDSAVKAREEAEIKYLGYKLT